MAEKKERIGITKFKETETPDFELCAYHLITRQEVIERIEKVLEESWWSNKTFRQISEAILDALTGGKDA